MTGAIVRSVNLGAPEPNPAKTTHTNEGETELQTGHGKQPVPEAVLRDPGPKHGGLGSGLVGDYIGDVEHHGGDRQAVYAVAREELDGWERRLGLSLPDGAFGENLTTLGLDVDAARVGDRWAVGAEVVLEVAGPRIPCSTFNLQMSRRGVTGWMKAFTDHARPGAYLAIVSGGTVRVGDAVEVVARASHDVALPETFRAFMGDLDAARTVLAADFLPEDENDWLRERLAARS